MGESDGEERFLNIEGVGDDLFKAMGDEGNGELDGIFDVESNEHSSW